MSAYGVLFDVATQQLDAQLATVDALDAKSATVFSVGSTLAAVVPALLPLGKDGFELKSWPFAFLVAAGVAYAITLGIFLWEYRPGLWRVGPDIERLKPIMQWGEEYARRWAADAYVLSVERTRHAMDKKGRRLTWLIWAFAVEAIFLVAAGVATFVR
ncbi:MAG: hypothetical protein ACYDCQ_20035 [Dehalococcoidia bacterium]